MRLSRSSTSTSSSALAALFLLVSTASALDRAECLRSRAPQLASLATCGHEGSILYCLSQLPTLPHQCTDGKLAKCFVNAGCTYEEARSQAEWTLRECDNLPAAAADELGDLRRRQRTTDSGDDNDAPPTRTQGNNRPLTTPPAERTTAPPQPAVTPDQTTEDQPTTEVVVVTEGDSTISSFKQTSTPLVCFTTTTISTTTCPVQSTGPQSGKQTLPCFPTQVSFPTCAAGLLCKSDAQGNPVCMKIENTFSTAGVIISLFFAVAVTIAVAATCFFCCRERRAQSKLRKAAEAAAIAKAAALDKKRPSVGVRSVSAQSDQAPLMGAHPGQSIVYEQAQDPFSDHNRMR